MSKCACGKRSKGKCTGEGGHYFCVKHGDVQYTYENITRPGENRKAGITDIKSVSNYYGYLQLKHEGGRYYWGMEDETSTSWSEISKELYDLIIKEEAND